MKNAPKPLKKGKKISSVKPLTRTIETIKPLMTIR
jgi:hypothetical protein